MQKDANDILASRLNFDVEAFRGQSRHELVVIGCISLTFTLIILSIFTRMLFGLWMIGIGLSFPVSIGVGWLVTSILQKYKSNKPKGYLKQLFYCRLEDKGILQSPYIRYSGKWIVRRIL